MANVITTFIDSAQELLSLMYEMMSLSLKIWSLGITLIFQLLIVTAGLILLTWLLLKITVKMLRQGEPGYTHIAFFHPYCNAGGGGERVLWCAIRAIQIRYPKVKCYVYTGDTDASPQDILQKVQQRFNVILPRPVEFIFLNFRTLVEAKHYPVLTLLMQSLGSVLLAGEALSKFRPDIYIDTMGYAFSYPVFYFIGGCVVGSYTHYPTISTDMLGRVAEGIEAHNNQRLYATNVVFRTMKLAYYHIFAILYSLVGRCAQIVMVNSTWTYGHITSLWGQSNRISIVYPPCDTETFKNLPLISDNEKDLKTIISIGQFRPEKDHRLQLLSFHKLCQILNSSDVEKIRLILVGGCRNETDQQFVQNLKSYANELGIEEKVVWKLNVPFADLLNIVKNGTIGLHTMWNEHFGICVVECMAGGLIMVAHDSGGPKMDIVVDYEGQKTGYKALDVESFAQTMKNIIESTSEERESIRNAARNSVDRFSYEKFESEFISAVEELFSSDRPPHED